MEEEGGEARRAGFSRRLPPNSSRRTSTLPASRLNLLMRIPVAPICLLPPREVTNALHLPPPAMFSPHSSPHPSLPFLNRAEPRQVALHLDPRARREQPGRCRGHRRAPRGQFPLPFCLNLPPSLFPLLSLPPTSLCPPPPISLSLNTPSPPSLPFPPSPPFLCPCPRDAIPHRTTAPCLLSTGPYRARGDLQGALQEAARPAGRRRRRCSRGGRCCACESFPPCLKCKRHP